MKATIKFDLNNPEEQKAHLRCLLSSKMAQVLWQINNNGYKKLKGDDDEIYNIAILDAIEYFRDLMEENGININELID